MTGSHHHHAEGGRRKQLYCQPQPLSDVALASKKRENSMLQNKLHCIHKQEEYARKLHQLNRTRLMKELISIDKQFGDLKRTNFDISQYPVFWEEEEGGLPKVAVPLATVRVEEPTVMLYGQQYFPSRGGAHSQVSQVSESEVSHSEESQPDSILEDVRRMKLQACARQPTPKLRTVTENKFVHQFEWLDTLHTKWFMEKASKTFHAKLMSEMRQSSDRKPGQQRRHLDGVSTRHSVKMPTIT